MPARKAPLPRAQHRALTLLGGSPAGCTEAIMLAHGFTEALLSDLVRAGLATAHVDRMVTGKRPMEVLRLKITDAGRRVVQT
jgi:hypothetical protein